MRTFTNNLLAVVALVAVAACSSAFNRDEITGQGGQIWDVVRVGETAISPQAAVTPYLGFRAADVWGFTGCNRLSGGTISTSGRVELAAMACTMMSCPDDTLEAPFLAALAQVEKAQLIGQRLCLTDGKGNIVVQLQRRATSRESLDGTWLVHRLNSQAIDTLCLTADTASDEAESVPHLRLDVAKAQFSGFTGCNRLLGTLDLSEANAGRVRLNVTGGSRMRCDDNHFEQAMLSALREVMAFTVQGDELTLCDEAGNAVLTFTKVATSRTAQ